MADNEERAQRDTRPFLRRALDAFGNIFGLSICFVVASIPIVTVGASLTATYAMAMRLQEDREEYILRGFIHEFKRSFKQATLTWLLILVAAAVMFAEYIVVNTVEGGLGILYMIVLILEVVFVAFTLPFLFPLIAYYENSFWQTIRNALFLSFGYIGSWLKITVAWVAPIAFYIIYPELFLATWYLWLLLIPGAIIYGTSFTARKVFNKNKEMVELTAEKEKENAKKKAREAKDNPKRSLADKANSLKIKEEEYNKKENSEEKKSEDE